MQRYLSKFPGSLIRSYADSISAAVKIENSITCIHSGAGTGKTMLAPYIIASAFPTQTVFVVYPTRALSVIALDAFLQAGGSPDIVGRSVSADRIKRRHVRVRLISATELIKHPATLLKDSVVVFDDAHVTNVGSDLAMGYIDALITKGSHIRRVFMSHNGEMLKRLADFWGSKTAPVRTLDIGSTVAQPNIQYIPKEGSVDDIFELIKDQISKGRSGFIVYCSTTHKANELEALLRKMRRTHPMLRSAYSWHWTEETCMKEVGTGTADGTQRFANAKVRILIGSGVAFREQATRYEWVDCGISDNLVLGKRCVNNIVYTQRLSCMDHLISETHSCDKLNDAGLLAFQPEGSFDPDPLDSNVATTHMLPELFEIFKQVNCIHDVRMFSVQSESAKRVYSAHLSTLILLGVMDTSGHVTELGRETLLDRRSPRIAAAYHVANELGIVQEATPLLAVLDYIDWTGGRFPIKTVLNRKLYGDVDYSDILKIAVVVYGSLNGVGVCGTGYKTNKKVGERCHLLYSLQTASKRTADRLYAEGVARFIPSAGGIWTCDSAFSHHPHMRDKLLAVIGAYYSDCLWNVIDSDMLALVGSSDKVGRVREHFAGKELLKRMPEEILPEVRLAGRLNAWDSGVIESAETTILTPTAYARLRALHPNAEMFCAIQDAISKATPGYIKNCKK